MSGTAEFKKVEERRHQEKTYWYFGLDQKKGIVVALPIDNEIQNLLNGQGEYCERTVFECIRTKLLLVSRHPNEVVFHTTHATVDNLGVEFSNIFPEILGMDNVDALESDALLGWKGFFNVIVSGLFEIYKCKTVKGATTTTTPFETLRSHCGNKPMVIPESDLSDLRISERQEVGTPEIQGDQQDISKSSFFKSTPFCVAGLLSVAVAAVAFATMLTLKELGSWIPSVPPAGTAGIVSAAFLLLFMAVAYGVYQASASASSYQSV